MCVCVSVCVYECIHECMYCDNMYRYIMYMYALHQCILCLYAHMYVRTLVRIYEYPCLIYPNAYFTYFNTNYATYLNVTPSISYFPGPSFTSSRSFNCKTKVYSS